jgi:membrane-associated protease RseP (regulator of RpoE activity)
MRSLISLAAAVVVFPALGFAAEPPVSKDFAFEVIVPKALPGQVLAMRCREGCTWTAETFKCPPSENECRAIVANHGVDDGRTAPPKPEAKSLPDAVGCLGLRTIMNPPGQNVLDCKTWEDKNGSGKSCRGRMVPAKDSRSYVNDVWSGSPVETAGMEPGDLLVSFDGTPMQDFWEYYVKMLQEAKPKPGLAFDAVLERDGSRFTVQGHWGIRMSDGKCATFSPALLEAGRTAAPDPNFPDFFFAVDVPPGQIQTHCLRGCADSASGSYCDKADGCTFAYRQYDNVIAHGSGTMELMTPEMLKEFDAETRRSNERARQQH